MNYMQWWKENRARVREEVARDPSFFQQTANPNYPDLCEVFKGPLRKCRHPSLYVTGPRRGQCTVCHEPTRSVGPVVSKQQLE